MNFEILISTMNLQNPQKFLQARNINSDAIIINQCNEEHEQIIKYNNHTIKIYSTKERGLSKSRNMALRKATAKYVLFADDDIVYKKDYVKLIENFIKKNNSSIYIFRILKNMQKKCLPKKIGNLSAFRIFSPEILINREDVLNHEIKFDENFGIGAQYTCGEETIFLSDCIKKKLKIVNSNELIGLEVKSRPSYWYRGLNEKVLESTGAAMARISKKLSAFYIIQFCVRKHKYYKKEHVSFVAALKVMLKSQRKYIQKFYNKR